MLQFNENKKKKIIFTNKQIILEKGMFLRTRINQMKMLSNA